MERARFSPLLPTLALLLGAFGLFCIETAQAQSSDSTLRALAVEVSTDGMDFSPHGIHPEFSATVESFSTGVQAMYTHVRLTATANHSGATLRLGKTGSLSPATSGSPSAAIALASGTNQILVVVTAQNGVSGQTYTLTVGRGGRVSPSVPRNVQVTPGTAKLTLTWTAPAHWGSLAKRGYDIDWYVGTAAPTEADWNKVTPVPSPLAATATSYVFTGTYGSHTVADGNTYRLRVRSRTVSATLNDPDDYLVSFWAPRRAGTPPTGPSLSSDNRLGGLTASSSTSANGTYSTLALMPSTFSATTTSYTATVVNAITHVRLTPTVADTGKATVGVRKGGVGSFAPVTSGTASAPIPLDVGANVITVRVTAQDSTVQDYTVTVTRGPADTTGPAPPTFDPRNLETVTNAGRNITLTFGEAIRRNSSAAQFTTEAHLKAILTLKRTNSGGTNIGYSASIDTAKRVITINPSANLPEGAIYVAISSGYYDGNSNPGTQASATFTVDTTGPAAPTFDPRDGETVTNTGRDITLTFGEAIRRNSSAAEFTTEAHLKAILTLKRTNSSGANIGYSASIDTAKRVITINPSSSLVDGTVYVAISSGYYDGNGNPGTQASATFTVDSTGVSAPVFDPRDGETVTDAGRNITLTFDEAIKKDTQNADFDNADLASVLTLKRTNSSGANIGYSASIDTAGQVITINPSASLPEGAIYVAISSGYYDGNGNQGRAASATFTVDTVGPAPPAFDPRDGETVTNAGRDITLTFGETVRRGSDGAEFTTEAHLKAVLTLRRTDSRGVNIDYSASIDGARQVITINPSASLPEGAIYVAISSGYYDENGNQGRAASATFTVDSTGVSAPVFDPRDGETVTDAGRNITLTFGERVRRASDGAEFTTEAHLKAVLTLRRTDSSGVNIDYSASIDTARQVITINPSANLPEGEIYVAISDGYYDGNGNQGRAASATFTVDSTDGTIVTPPNGSVPGLVPSFGSARIADQLYTVGTAIAALQLPQATGGDGVLTYRLIPTPPPGLVLDTATRVLSGTPTQRQGALRYVWQVTDANGDMDEIGFTITVQEKASRAREEDAAKRTLAAMARQTMSSALDSIGARFGVIGADELRLSGQEVPLEDAEDTGLPPCPPEQLEGETPGAPSQRSDQEGSAETRCVPDVQSRSQEADEVFSTSAFSLRLDAAESESDPTALQWSVWGRGDLGTFAGRGSADLRYDGELRTGWLGMDARSDSWVAGLAVSHGEGKADYGFAGGELSGRGRLEITLSAFYPYWRWRLENGLEVRAVVGAGAGEARHEPEDRAREKGDLKMQMASAGVQRALPDLAGTALAVRADASLVRFETEDGPDVVHGLGADSWQLRAGMEASRHFALAGEALFEPFLEAAAQQDGGDGLEGRGLELAGGLRYVAPGVAVEARGRWLAMHSEAGAQEQGVSLTARAGPGASGRGLWLALNSHWGMSDAQASWGEEMPAPSISGAGGAIDAQLGYGLGMPKVSGVLTPFLEAGLAGRDTRRLRLGTRFDALGTGFGAELAGERSERAAEPEHALRLDLQLQF